MWFSCNTKEREVKDRERERGRLRVEEYHQREREREKERAPLRNIDGDNLAFKSIAFFPSPPSPSGNVCQFCSAFSFPFSVSRFLSFCFCFSCSCSCSCTVDVSVSVSVSGSVLGFQSQLQLKLNQLWFWLCQPRWVCISIGRKRACCIAYSLQQRCRQILATETSRKCLHRTN